MNVKKVCMAAVRVCSEHGRTSSLHCGQCVPRVMTTVSDASQQCSHSACASPRRPGRRRPSGAIAENADGPSGAPPAALAAAGDVGDAATCVASLSRTCRRIAEVLEIMSYSLIQRR